MFYDDGIVLGVIVVFFGLCVVVGKCIFDVYGYVVL